MEFHPLTQRERQGPPILGQRPRLGQAGKRLAARVEVDEWVEHATPPEHELWPWVRRGVREAAAETDDQRTATLCRRLWRNLRGGRWRGQGWRARRCQP